MKQKEQEIRGKKSNVNYNIFKESESTAKLFPTRKNFHEEFAKKKKDNKIHSIKTFAIKYNSSETGNLLKNKPCKTINMSPINKTKPISRAPSEYTKKLNDKKLLMPCEVEDIYHQKYKRTISVNKSLNTGERIFSEFVLRDKSQQRTLTTNKSSSHFYPTAKDNIGQLLEYKYGPRFKKEV
jgi:hypothetical protein